jgi:uncharacterized protein YbjT (DUF2867 family)
MLGRQLLREGWAVRGTSRRADGLVAIEAAGLDAALADPERPATLVELLGDVTVVHWLLGSAAGDEAALAAVHGPRLERFLEKLVDTPVRGFVYERAGSVAQSLLDGGGEIAEVAAVTWRIPVELVDLSPVEPSAWVAEMLKATARTISGAGKSYS